MMQWDLLLLTLISVGNFSFCLPPFTEATGQGQLQKSTAGPGTVDIKCLTDLSPESFTTQDGPFITTLQHVAQKVSSEPCFSCFCTGCSC